MKKINLVLGLCSALLFFVACGQVQGVKLDKSSVPMAVGSTEQLKASIEPAESVIKTILWSTSASDIATVSLDGLITGVSIGNADITVTTKDGSKTAVCKVTVGITLKGTAAFTDKAGSFLLTFNNAGADCIVNGTMNYDNTSYQLTGTYTTATGAITASYTTADPQFEISGNYISGEFIGTVKRTIASVVTIASASAQTNSGGTSVQLYLGTFGRDTLDSGLGTWNMSVKGEDISGTFAYDSVSGNDMLGRFIGKNIAGAMSVTTTYILDENAYFDISNAPYSTISVISGSFSETGLTGIWDWKENNGDPVDSGKFTGTLQK